MAPALIELDGVSKRFDAVEAVSGADLTIDRGEILALLGPSGCGKTTLLRLLAGFEEPDAGTILIEGRPVAGRAWVPPERRRVGMVFQDYALFPHLSVGENVGFGLARRERSRRVAEVLGLVGLGGLQGRYPHALSGGQQQRVALARALAPRPAIVLLDEPWSSIDPVLRVELRDELAASLRAAGVTAFLVTHEQEEAFSLADRIALMRDGRILQTCAPEELYFAPATRWAAQFIGTANLLPGRVAGGRVETALGSFPAATDGRDRVEVLVRPELVELRLDADGSACVVAREFRGHDVFYRLLLDDGTTLCSHRPSTEAIPLGARVRLIAHQGRVALFS